MSAGSLDVETIGRGRNLLLLHSLLSDRSAFATLGAKLASRRHLILVNLPGFGSSPPARPTLPDYADAVASVFDELRLGADADVLGNGLGSFVALSLALRHGARFARLVLVGTAAAFPEPGRAVFRTLADKAEAGAMAELAPVAMLRMFPEEYLAAHPDVVADREAVFKRIDPAVFAGACRALAALDLRAELGAIRNPTLIVAGALDSATPPALARELAAGIAGAQLIELPGVGHSPHIQDPAALLAAIGPFLEIER